MHPVVRLASVKGYLYSLTPLISLQVEPALFRDGILVDEPAQTGAVKPVARCCSENTGEHSVFRFTSGQPGSVFRVNDHVSI